MCVYNIFYIYTYLHTSIYKSTYEYLQIYISSFKKKLCGKKRHVPVFNLKLAILWFFKFDPQPDQKEFRDLTNM